MVHDGIGELAKILGLDSGAIDGLLSSKVEAAVHDLRRASPATPVAEVARPLAPSPTA